MIELLIERQTQRLSEIGAFSDRYPVGGITLSTTSLPSGCEKA